MPPRHSARLRFQRQTANGNSRLLKLPPELRNMIWSCVILVDDSYLLRGYLDYYDIDVDKDCQVLSQYGPTCHGSRPRMRVFAFPQVMRLCSQICSEVGSLLYSTNTFVFGIAPWSDHRGMADRTFEIAQQWVHATGNLGLKHMRRLLLVEFEECEPFFHVKSRTILLDLRLREARALSNDDMDQRTWETVQKDVELVKQTGALQGLPPHGEMSAKQLVEIIEKFAIRSCRKLRRMEDTS